MASRSDGRYIIPVVEDDLDAIYVEVPVPTSARVAAINDAVLTRAVQFCRDKLMVAVSPYDIYHLSGRDDEKYLANYRSSLDMLASPVDFEDADEDEDDYMSMEAEDGSKNKEQAEHGALPRHLSKRYSRRGTLKQRLSMQVGALSADEELVASEYSVFSLLPEASGTRCAEYVTELYSSLWDIALEKKKTNVDIRITSQVLPASRFRTTFQLLCSGAVRSFLTVLPAFPSAVIVELVQKEREKRQLPPLVVRRLEISDLPMLVSSMFFEDSYEEMHGVVSQVAMGGTFDQLHNGHKKLLFLGATSARDRLFVGVTSDAMLAHKRNADQIQPCWQRCKAVIDFLRSILVVEDAGESSQRRAGGAAAGDQTLDDKSRTGGGNDEQHEMEREVKQSEESTRGSPNSRRPDESVSFCIRVGSLLVQVKQIDDPMGPTVTDPAFDGIVASCETLRGCQVINELRAERGMAPLKLLLTRRTNASALSSTFIRSLKAKN